MTLTGKARRFLRAKGHDLDPVVQIGKEGVTDRVAEALDQALLDHELVKVKIGKGAVVDRGDAATTLAERTGSEVAQVLGRTILLYRPHPEDPKIILPR